MNMLAEIQRIDRNLVVKKLLDYGIQRNILDEIGFNDEELTKLLYMVERVKSINHSHYGAV